MAREFDGNLEFYALPDSATLSVTGALTLSCWMYVGEIDTGAENTGMIAKYQSETGATNRRAYTIYQNDQTIGFALSTDGTFQSANVLTTGNVITATSVWRHICATFDPSTRTEIWIDAVSQASDTTSVAASIADTAAPLWVGQQFNSTSAGISFLGRIAEPAVWAATLSSSEIAALYAGRKAWRVRPESLRMCADLFGPGDPVDWVSGLAMTANGTPAVADHAPVELFTPRPYFVLANPAVGGGFQPAWARGSTVTLQPGVAA